MNVIRIHASPDEAATARVRTALEAFPDVAGVTVVPGELIGDVIEVVVAGDDDSPLHEGEIRSAVLHAIDRPVDPPADRSVLDRLTALEAAVAELRAGTVHVSAIQEPAPDPVP